jgi:hypothetical protein
MVGFLSRWMLSQGCEAQVGILDVFLAEMNSVCVQKYCFTSRDYQRRCVPSPPARNNVCEARG